MTDDRQEFEDSKRGNALRMGADPEVFRHSLELTAAADRYHFSYFWSWLGLPIIQMPTDIVIMQEIIWAQRPQVVIETGIARGGSLILYSSLFELIGEGRVIGVDIEVRSHNREAIETHPLSGRITIVEGSSVDENVVDTVRNLIGPDDRVMVVLDASHTHDHVLRELRAYGSLVTPGQFLVVADTIVEMIPPQTHRPRPWGPGNNPYTALKSYLAECPRFVEDEYVNAKLLLTSSPGGYLRCIAT